VRIENTFEVPAPPERAWDLLMDVPRVVPCMPGAELTDVVGDSAWKAKMNVKLGPISLTFATDVERVEADEAARRAKLSARAREVRGRGGGQATIESTLVPMDGGTRVEIVTDLTLSGPVAQYGRGMVADVSSQLVQRFADCLEAELAGPRAEAAEAATAVPQAEAAPKSETEPLAGLPLLVTALRRALARALRTLAERAEPTERSKG
jgi:uncharacterized protein